MQVRKILFALTFSIFFSISLVSAQGTLSKTVGTSPEICGTSQVITVPSGTTVYYCYTLSNTSSSSSVLPTDLITETIPGGFIDYHTLFDDKLGYVFQNISSPIGPGSSVIVSATAVITKTTTNTATWEAYFQPPALTDTIPGTVRAQSVVFTSSGSATVNVSAAGVTAPIPTLSEWGIILLTAVLIGTGLLFLRARKLNF
jgi:hypothetical protein